MSEWWYVFVRLLQWFVCCWIVDVKTSGRECWEKNPTEAISKIILNQSPQWLFKNDEPQIRFRQNINSKIKNLNKFQNYSSWYRNVGLHNSSQAPVVTCRICRWLINLYGQTKDTLMGFLDELWGVTKVTHFNLGCPFLLANQSEFFLIWSFHSAKRLCTKFCMLHPFPVTIC